MAYVIQSLQASPEFKGIKTNLNNYLEIVELQASPEFKGIKTTTTFMCWKGSKLQASPEFKGIKTSRVGKTSAPWGLQASPEFKGIKTDPQARGWRWHSGFKPALNSKGLRHSASQAARSLASSQP